ncbi:unnamed protein product [Phytomonas sp. Hart1]|nr:unnamed protein product [Phytomonas sp. Hart1]|eukprot:CCW67524.1 unnamed protein product [Phytomonas sp. isolate Hart1]
MSNRQIRRLHHLIRSSTGIDEEEPEDIGIVTMKPNASSKGRRKKNDLNTEKRNNKSETSGGDKADTVSNVTRTPNAAATCQNLRENLCIPTTCPSEVPKTGGHDNETHVISASVVDASPTGSASPISRGGTEYPAVCETHLHNHRNAKKQSKGSKKSKRETEEEKLLEAVLRERDRAQGDSGDRTNVELRQSEPFLGVLMLICEPEHLDMRLEHIRNFGLEAVEDVGDNTTPFRPHRRLRDSGPNSLLPEHHLNLSFRHSAFATPRKHRWPPFDSLGIRMVVASTNPKDARGRRGTPTNPNNPNSAAPLVYRLDCDSTQFKQAEGARLACEARIGNLQDLINCLHRGPYHIPTLLQLYATFRALGNTVRASEMVDLALYHVGVLFSRFPIAETWCKRLVPYDYPKNQILFQALQCGVHVALQRGCARTAWEISRFVLSLDPRDPCGMMLLMDYLALRAKRWVWLVEAHQTSLRLLDKLVQAPNDTAEKNESQEGAIKGREGPQDPSLTPYRNDQIDLYLARRVSVLPSFAFSAVLAKYFLERDMEQYQNAQPTQGTAPTATHVAMRARGRPKKKPQSKILRNITPAQHAMLEAAAPSTAMLAQAIVRFPGAAAKLVERLQGVDAICKGATVDPVWQDVILGLAASEEKQSMDQEDGMPHLSSHLNQFFVARHADLWKSAEPMKLMRSVLSSAEHKDDHGCPSSEVEGAQTPPTPLVMALAERNLSQYRYLKDKDITEMYLALREEDIMGMDSNAAIPQELLDLGAQDFDDADIIEQLMEQENDGGIQEHFHHEDGRHSRGENLSPQRDNILQFFMNTLFPWNNLNDAAHQQESRHAGGASSLITGSDGEDDWEDLEASSDTSQ